MSASNAFETELIDLIFNNAAIANVGDATGLPGSATAGSLYLSLHTADPGEAGDQTTNETSYGSYARVAVARTSSGWTVSGNAATLTSAVSFAEATSGTATITHFGVGTSSSGAGLLLCSGAVTPNISVATGVTPQLTTSTSVSLD